MIKFSVIIPHKDCPDLLSRCINSIPKRDDVEIIVVDDCSTDLDSVKQLERENTERNVTFVYTTEKKGAGFARNQGLKKATGKWLIFADADDFFTNEAFGCFDKFADSNFDIIYFPHKSVYSETLEPCERYNVRNSLINIWLSDKTEDNLDNVRFQDVVPWSKMFRKSGIAGLKIKFDEVPASNDVMFVIQASTNTNNFYVSSETVYVLTYRKGSITRIANKTNDFSRFQVALRYNNYMKEVGHPEMKRRVFSHILLALRSYGVKEALLYFKEARKMNQSVFAGSVPSFNEIVKKISLLLHKDAYKG